MGGKDKTKSKDTASAPSTGDALGGMSSTERILRRIHDLYAKGLVTSDGSEKESGSVGILEIAADPLLNLTDVHKPRKKVNVMIIGNHSAGKSSFINWYINEDVQTTGVAIETRGFTYVTSGRKRETLKGDATFAFYDHIDGLQKFKGITENVFTEISTSKAKNFGCVDLLDSPGLVDGEMEYPFDVVESIVYLADHVDLILCFFDPIGQALCKRTMTAVERLNEKHAEKLAYYMSKADQVEKEHDRQRVLIQITQNLAGRIKNSHAFKLPTIYLPRDEDRPLKVPIPNALEEVCEDVDKAIRLTVQKNLTTMKDDCLKILTEVDKAHLMDKEHRKENNQRALKGWGFTFIEIIVGVITLYVSLCETFAFGPVRAIVTNHLLPMAKQSKYDVLEATLVAFLPDVDSNTNLLKPRWLGIPHGGAYVLLVLTCCLVAIEFMKRKVWQFHSVMTKKDVRRLAGYKEYVKELGKVREELYKEYFKGLQGDRD